MKTKLGETVNLKARAIKYPFFNETTYRGVVTAYWHGTYFWSEQSKINRLTRADALSDAEQMLVDIEARNQC